VTPYAHSYVRLGPGIVNSEADIDAAVSALRALRR
jgi:selenocysteine lyase/cysteine desulfurase